jgi:hypothetical protein
VSVVDEGLDLVLYCDAGRNGFDRIRSHVLVLVHESVHLEVHNVDHHDFFIGRGQDAAKETLGCGNVGYGSTSPGSTSPGYWMRLPPTV